MNNTEIKLYDVTLRDGAQTEGVSFSVKDKIRILHLLDEIGMSYIEGGWPGSNPKDTELYQLMKKEKLQKAILIAFGSSRRAGNKAENDPVLKALIEAGAPHVNIFAKGWDFHVTEALKISLEENLDLIYDSISYLKKYVPGVSLGIEHFFDGYKANPEYVIKVIKTAEAAGASWVGAADTNGGCMPDEIGRIFTEAKKHSKLVKTVHMHQDTGLAVANTIKAIECGATIIHGTINGIGERCGMIDFCTLLPNLKLKLGINCVSDEQLTRMREVALIVAECGGFKVPKYSPYVGQCAFYHKGGVHVDAILKNPKTYNHIDPVLVGNEFTTAISELSGKANILLLASQYGITIEEGDPRIIDLLNYIKDQEQRGFQFDGAGATRFLLFKTFLEGYKTHINIDGFNFKMNKNKTDNVKNVLDDRVAPDIEATVDMTIGNKEEHITVSSRKGPLAALAEAVTSGINKYFENIGNRIKVFDFKVQVLDYTYVEGNIHKLRILLGIIDLDTNENFYTVGAAHDIYTAFLKAFIDGIEYKIIKSKK